MKHIMEQRAQKTAEGTQRERWREHSRGQGREQRALCVGGCGCCDLKANIHCLGAVSSSKFSK
jgi:hypothetical protein